MFLSPSLSLPSATHTTQHHTIVPFSICNTSDLNTVRRPAKCVSFSLSYSLLSTPHHPLLLLLTACLPSSRGLTAQDVVLPLTPIPSTSVTPPILTQWGDQQGDDRAAGDIHHWKCIPGSRGRPPLHHRLPRWPHHLPISWTICWLLR